MRKAIAITSIFALMMGYAVVPASFAADNDTTIVNSGDNSDVTTSVTENTKVTVKNMNIANISQESMSVNNTGNNTANGNIAFPDVCGNPCLSGGTGITTGNAASTNTMAVDANTNTTLVDLPSSGTSTSSTNVVNTGDDLDVDTASTTNTTVEVRNTNFANVFQSSVSMNNTGWNQANGNIGDTGIVTGAAGSVNDMSAHVNANTTAISVGSGTVYPGGSSFADCPECIPTCDGAGNCSTIVNSGDGLDVTTRTTTNTRVEVNNFNMLNAWQMASALNNSGWNRSNDNIYGASIATGNAGSTTGMSIDANRNQTGVVLDESMPLGTLSFMTLKSGDKADLDSTANTNTTVSELGMNFLCLDQQNMSWSSSGWNVSVENIGGTGTSTGHTGGASNMNATGNNNTTLVGGVGYVLELLSWLV